ncbi:MAG TPA: hypothetical protein ENG75_02420 [Nitrospirae bacterium]|nr:hypothetical protein [Nitrospirota bacterium]HDK16783.1 hypothetical protein [Nitrospirota bacterium]
MIKRILIIAVLSLVIFQGAAFAVETEGEVLFRDALYGAAIGAILGGAFYLADEDNFANKFATGVIIGTVGGLVFGLSETNTFVEIEKDKIKFAVPAPVIEKKQNGFQYSASILRTRF